MSKLIPRRCAPTLLAISLFAGGTLADGFHNPGHAKGYFQGTWSAVHGDSSNSDYIPIVSTQNVEQAWHVLPETAPWTAPAIGQDGTMYFTSARGKGYSHLHAVSPDGDILWESPPEQGSDDLDAMATTSSPVLDENGDIYVGDANQLWAFRPHGEVKWVIDLSAHGVKGNFVTAMIVGDYVGGVSIHGQVVLFHRDSGALIDLLDLPGTDTEPGDDMVRGLWQGFVSPQYIQRVWDVLMGYSYEIANSPAVHPKTGRIYIIGAGETRDKGAFYGIDLLDGKLNIAFITETPPNSGTSPAISPDGERVYAMADGALFAIDANNGKKLWSTDVDGRAASPSVSPDDIIYVLGGKNLPAVNGRDGSIAWSASYKSFAMRQLPKLWTRFGLLTTGEPDAYIDSVVAITKNHLWASLLLSYDMQLFGTEFSHASRLHLVVLDPKDGSIIRSWPVPSSSESGISLSPAGDVYLSLLAAQSSIAHNAGYQWLLPAQVRMPKPVGGVVGFRVDRSSSARSGN